jgi:hypothetical protein
MTGVFHLWLRPEEPLYSKHRETDLERAEFARTNNVVFMGYPPTLDVFLYEVRERDLIVARCDSFCGVGRAVGAAYIQPGARALGRAPHYRKVEWLVTTGRGPTDPYEGFLRGLNMREAMRDITTECAAGPLAGFI